MVIGSAFGLPLRHWIAAAAIFSASGAWAGPSGIIAAAAPQAGAATAVPAAAASLPPAATGADPAQDPDGDVASRQIMMLMLLDRARGLAPLARLAR